MIKGEARYIPLIKREEEKNKKKRDEMIAAVKHRMEKGYSDVGSLSHVLLEAQMEGKNHEEKAMNYSLLFDSILREIREKKDNISSKKFSQIAPFDRDAPAPQDDGSVPTKPEPENGFFPQEKKQKNGVFTKEEMDKMIRYTSGIAKGDPERIDNKE